MAQAVPIIAASLATTAATAGTVHQYQQSEKASRQGKQAFRRQERGQAELERQLGEDEAKAEKTSAVRLDRAAQRSAAAARLGRRSTILTGNLGLIGEPTGERRTLLGS